MSTKVQTIAKNVSTSNDFTSDVYKNEQAGAWSLEINMNSQAKNDFFVTLQVSNDQINWRNYIIINEKVDKLCGGSWVYNWPMPFDFIRIVVKSSNGDATYNILFNERWQRVM